MNQTIRFATFLAPNMLPVYQFTADYIGRQLGLPTHLFTGTTFNQFAGDEADVGFICGLPYVRLVEQRPSPVQLLAAPVLRGERFENRPIYYSDVIVRQDSPYHTFADLRGSVWAYNEPDSQSGCAITMYHLAQMQATAAYFGQVVRAGSHQRAIQLILTGQVDAAAVDCQVLAVEMAQQPALTRQLRVIDLLGPSPIPPVVAASRLPAGLKADIQAVLWAMGDDPEAVEALAYGFIHRFAPVADSDYDAIRQIAATAAAVRPGLADFS